MNSKQLNGLPVFNISNGEKLGSVVGAYLDAATKRVLGFAFAAGGSLMSVESEPKVDSTDIHALGPSALTLDGKDAVKGSVTNERFGELEILDSLNGRRVLTEGGTALGQVASVEFDVHSFELTQVEVSLGRFAGSRPIPIDQVVSIGPDFVIIRDAHRAGKDEID